MLWNQLPNDMETKLVESTSSFKNLIEYSWVLTSCVSQWCMVTFYMTYIK